MKDVITEAVDHLLREPYATTPNRVYRRSTTTCRACGGGGWRREWLRAFFMKVECEACAGTGKQ